MIPPTHGVFTASRVERDGGDRHATTISVKERETARSVEITRVRVVFYSLLRPPEAS
ncbi:hypothetical protein BN903_3 [Halorubrum sp. AJ67]|nr:hypothetical protein BN903_3 [Halorubrum sp. AJ67]